MSVVFESLRSIKRDTVIIDNFAFRLHYMVTFGMLCVFSIVTTATQYFGKPISCNVQDIDPDFINQYCWTHSTFTILNSKTGLGNYVEGKDTKLELTYYQWVPVMLTIQALMLLVPRVAWKVSEGGMVRAIVSCLKFPVVRDQRSVNSMKRVVNYLFKSHNFKTHYALKFFFCEMLNLINVLGQIYMLNEFLDGQFITYGLEIIHFALDGGRNMEYPMIKSFPIMSKCTFHKYGPSGTIEKLDRMCVLGMNVFNEKIFSLLWFWLLALALITALSVVHSALVLKWPRLLPMSTPHSHRKVIRTIQKSFNVDHWLLLYNVQSNVDSCVFNELISHLAERLQEEEELLHLMNLVSEIDPPS